jgi:hypothetical protein
VKSSALAVVALRLAIPVSILRRPLPGAITSAALDAADVALVDAFARLLKEPRGFDDHYAQIDKWLDTYYLAVEALESLGWQQRLARKTSLALFGYRLVGVTLFERTGIRPLLLVFPNVFENFYWCVLVAQRVAPDRIPRSPRGMIAVVALVSVPKLGQEWLLHYAEAHPWQWLRARVVVPAFRRLGLEVPEDAPA